MNVMLKMVGAGLALLAAGCGYTDSERISGGGAAGAATGAAVGALAGPVGVLGGAAVGGLAGSVAGGVTEPETVNLGRPPWSNPNTNLPGTSHR